jgi:hypothetical protein
LSSSESEYSSKQTEKEVKIEPVVKNTEKPVYSEVVREE